MLVSMTIVCELFSLMKLNGQLPPLSGLGMH